MAGFCLDRAGAWKPLRKAGRRGGATSALFEGKCPIFFLVSRATAGSVLAVEGQEAREATQ